MCVRGSDNYFVSRNLRSVLQLTLLEDYPHQADRLESHLEERYHWQLEVRLLEYQLDEI